MKSKFEIRTGKIAALLLILAIAILLSALAGSVSFTTSPAITPLGSKNPNTDDNLTCSWNISADTTQQNVSWYRNGVLFYNYTNLSLTETSSVLSYLNTTRGEAWNCSIILSNGTDTATQYANVTIKNAPPSEPTMNDSLGQLIDNSTTVTEDQLNTFTLYATDPDGDKVTYGSWDTLSGDGSLNSQTGVLTWTPDYTATDINITFYAKDNQTLFENTNKFVMFTIVYVNDTPRFISSLTNTSIIEGQKLSYNITVSDEEYDYPINFSITSVTPSLPSHTLEIVNNSNTTATIRFNSDDNSSFNEAGTYVVNVTINDTAGNSNSSTFTLTINDTNVDPVLRTISNQTGTQDQSFYFYVYADDVDENDTLNFTIASLDCATNPWNITTVNNSHNATGLVNITLLTNDHVRCRSVNITVIDINDTGARDSQDVFLNISNTNDPPNVEVLSSYSSNTGGNNISNLSTYANSLFIYLVNATDIDRLTYENDTLTYSTNVSSSLFNISSSTGLVSFTPTQSMVGNHTINVTVTDLNGSSDYEIMVLEVRNNSAPVLNAIGNISCAEDVLCTIVISASDADNDDLNFTSTNSSIFNITNNNSQSPRWSGYVNFTPSQSQIGNHSITVNVTDIRGAFTNETFTFTINNTNDAPWLQNFNFPSRIVETHPVIFYVNATDDDYNLSGVYEYVTFNSTNVSGASLFNITTELNSYNNRTYATIFFTPSLGAAGNYTVNISATDYYNATAYRLKNFTVLNKTSPPSINSIMPYKLPGNTTTILNESISTSYFNTSVVSVNFSENRSVIYNISVNDTSTALENLTYNWFIDGTSVSTSSYINRTYNFFTSGTYNITVIVTDDTYENASWSWLVTVEDINRAPFFNSSNVLANISINATTTYTNYLRGGLLASNFVDPDDDNNSNNHIDNSESTTLTFTATSCSVATLSITGPNVTFTPTDVGSCTVTFTGTDSGGLYNTSNVVYINVSSVPEATEEVPVTQPTSGGGGGSSRSIVIPMQKQEDTPKAIDIIVPELVTIYENKTVLIPVRVQNTWNASLKEVRINATTNASQVQLRFSQDYFEELAIGEQKELTMFVDDYRLGENYEIQINANVTEPKASDSALVLLNTIEQSQSGEDVEVKVTFAQDLLNDNPECLELNELLNKAKEELGKGSAAEASKIVDGVINGCKYLVSISKKTEQKPETIISRLWKKENWKFLLVFAGIALVLVLSVLLVNKKKVVVAKEKEAEAKKAEEEQVKPYWE